MSNGETYRGSCLCGAVSYEVDGPLSAIWSCHCSQCRKTSGHLFATTDTLTENLSITDNGGLKWYDSSKWAQRGFCQNCGSSLFWRMPKENRTSILAGTLDDTRGLRLAGHIFTADKGAYYDIPPLERQFPGAPKGEWRDGDPGGT